MGEVIQFKRPDSKTCPGYLATPQAGSSAPGFVVIQEWWGLNDQIKGTADRLAVAGYRTLVADLYRGKVTTADDEANHLMANLSFPHFFSDPDAPYATKRNVKAWGKVQAQLEQLKAAPPSEALPSYPPVP